MSNVRPDPCGSVTLVVLVVLDPRVFDYARGS